MEELEQLEDGQELLDALGIVTGDNREVYYDNVVSALRTACDGQFGVGTVLEKGNSGFLSSPASVVQDGLNKVQDGLNKVQEQALNFDANARDLVERIALDNADTITADFGAPPGFLRQYLLILQRQAIQWIRMWKVRALDFTLIALSGAAIGLMHRGSQASYWPTNAMMLFMALGLLTAIASLRLFGNDRVQIWRDVSSGVLVLAIFCGRTTIDLFDVMARGFLFAVVYSCVNPSTEFDKLVTTLLMCAFATSGLGYLCAAVMNPINSRVSAVLLALTFGGILSGVGPTLKEGLPKEVAALAYGRWCVEAHLQIQSLSIHEEGPRKAVANDLLKRLGHSMICRTGDCTFDSEGFAATGDFQHDPEQINICWYALLAQGVVLRLLTLTSLNYFNRDKMV